METKKGIAFLQKIHYGKSKKHKVTEDYGKLYRTSYEYNQWVN